MAIVSMKQLLEAGVHFGHQTKRWNPKMRQYIFTERNGIHIIDLQQTVVRLTAACVFVRSQTESGTSVLFVGTKRAAREAIEEEASRARQYWVTQRWLGGMLTNFQTIQQRIRRLQELKIRQERGDFEQLQKKEALKLTEEMERLQSRLGGIEQLRRPPGALFIVDTRKEHIAVAEARRLGIPIVALVDTNCNPEEVDFPIPANDDGMRAIRLLTAKVADACAEGRGLASASEATATDESDDLTSGELREALEASFESEPDYTTYADLLEDLYGEAAGRPRRRPQRGDDDE